MFIVPYIHKVSSENGLNIHCVHILTVGGKNLWEEDNSLDVENDILKVNDIWTLGEIITIDKTLKLCEVDTTKTKIHDFYKWSDIGMNDTDTFCWRNYIYILGPKGEVWLNLPNNERLANTSLNKLLTTIINKNNVRKV
jgi:hypothetical protein